VEKTAKNGLQEKIVLEFPYHFVTVIDAKLEEIFATLAALLCRIYNFLRIGEKSQNSLKQTIILQTKTIQTREVGQDSTTSARAREASNQPAPQQKVLRAHPLRTNTPRSQNQKTPKHHLVQLNIWVDPIVKAKLRDSAEHGQTSLSQASYEFLKRECNRILISPMARRFTRQLKTPSSNI
jgi:hypothetical protein